MASTKRKTAAASRPATQQRVKKQNKIKQRKQQLRRHAGRGPNAGLNARLYNPISKKYHTYFEIAENHDKKKKLDFKVTNDKTPPPGFTFVPVGNPDLNTLCKELSREQDALIFIVSETRERNQTLVDHVHRLGYHFRSSIVEEAVLSAGGIRHTTDQNRKPDPIPESQTEITRQADAAIKDLFPRIPNTDREMILAHAFTKGATFGGKPVVGMQADLPLSRRVQLAVVAHIRHTLTRYDKLLRETDWASARKAVEPVCLDILVKWRGDEETGRDQLDEVLREVVVITDSEDSDDGESADDEDETSDELESEDFVETDHVSCAAAASSRATGPAANTRSRVAGNRVLPGSQSNNAAVVDLDTPKTDRRGFKRYQAWKDAQDRRGLPTPREGSQVEMAPRRPLQARERDRAEPPSAYQPSYSVRQTVKPPPRPTFQRLEPCFEDDIRAAPYPAEGARQNQEAAYPRQGLERRRTPPGRGPPRFMGPSGPIYDLTGDSPRASDPRNPARGYQQPTEAHASSTMHPLQDMLHPSVERPITAMGNRSMVSDHAPSSYTGSFPEQVRYHHNGSPASRAGPPREVIYIDSPEDLRSNRRVMVPADGESDRRHAQSEGFVRINRQPAYQPAAADPRRYLCRADDMMVVDGPAPRPNGPSPYQTEARGSANRHEPLHLVPVNGDHYMSIRSNERGHSVAPQLRRERVLEELPPRHGPPSQLHYREVPGSGFYEASRQARLRDHPVPVHNFRPDAEGGFYVADQARHGRENIAGPAHEVLSHCHPPTSQYGRPNADDYMDIDSHNPPQGRDYRQSVGFRAFAEPASPFTILREVSRPGDVHRTAEVGPFYPKEYGGGRPVQYERRHMNHEPDEGFIRPVERREVKERPRPIHHSRPTYVGDGNRRGEVIVLE